MNRHPFRWEGLAFGLFFLACVGNWAVWERDLLTPRELSLTASGVLIALGVIGVAATLRPRPTPTKHDPLRPRPTPTKPDPLQHTPTPEGPHDEAADPDPR
nr:hypothetical protein [Aeromicrobium sp.]